MPAFFRELRLTMIELEGLLRAGDAGHLADLRNAAPELTRSTEALGPFSRAAREALISLGANAETAREDLVVSKPVVRDIGLLAGNARSTATRLRQLLTDFRENAGLENLMRFFFFATGATNGFDSFGHFMRAVVPVNNCFEYNVTERAGLPTLTSPRTPARLEARQPRSTLSGYLYEPIDATETEGEEEAAEQ